MRETGLIVVSTEDGSLFQLSLQEGSLTQKEIKHPCERRLYLLCVQVAGREYLALSCKVCSDIKLMDLNEHKEDNSKLPLMRHPITAFSGEKIGHMCHGEENRIFVDAGADNMLELDASTITFAINRASSLNPLYPRHRKLKKLLAHRPFTLEGLCYVPEPHRLIVVSKGCLQAVSPDDQKIVWTTRYQGPLLYLNSHDVILVGDKKNVVVLNPETGSEIQSIELPDEVRDIQALCLFNNQIIMASKNSEARGRILYFDLK